MEERTVFQPLAAGSVRPGARLNGIYEIERVVAQGGMGEVYRGFNIQTRDIVAIKMIRPELSSNPDVFDLFRREASVLHTLQHEAIVRYFVFSVDPELRRAYLAMEFVDGPSLSTRLGMGPLSLANAKILQKRIGSALDTAHRFGVIHRDISSDNIILPDGEVRSAKIIDFGIARARRADEVTIIGDGFAGKYNYVSPEQLGLAGGEVTFKSDIYSFGLVLAEALRGRPVDMGGSQAEIIDKRRSVPDLSDINPAIRPLIEAMLQPSPENRPASMAAVAAWEGPGKAGLPAAGAGRIKPAREASGGRAAILGALIALGSVAGATYVFRDEIGQWIGSTERLSTSPPTAKTTPSIGASTPTAETAEVSKQTEKPALPPIGPTPPLDAAPNSPIASSGGPMGQPASPSGQRVPTSDDLVEAMPPSAPKPVVDLPPATVGAPYRAELPAFIDRGGKGLRLAAASAPNGVKLTDLGGGRGVIEGAPAQAGSAAFQIVATNHNGATAQMTARLAISERVPSIAQSEGAAANDSAAQSAQSASAPPPPAEVAQPAPPSLLSPAPASPSQLPASLPTQVATAPLSQKSPAPEPAGPSPLQSTTASQPEPAPATGPPSTSTAGPTISSPKQQIASIEDRTKAFINGFDGGDCFLVKPMSGSGSPHAYLAVGRELQPFRRFDSAYRSEIGAEPQLSLRLIAPSQCRALDLIRLGSAGGRAAPRIELTNYNVGRGKPLMGTIADLQGRHLTLVLVGDDGVAHQLEARALPGRDAATFNVPLTPDASSIGPMQILIAVVSNVPVPALENFRSGPVSALSSLLAGEARSGSLSVAADFFKFVN